MSQTPLSNFYDGFLKKAINHHYYSIPHVIVKGYYLFYMLFLTYSR